jgi:hypothetical protein
MPKAINIAYFDEKQQECALEYAREDGPCT